MAYASERIGGASNECSRGRTAFSLFRMVVVARESIAMQSGFGGGHRAFINQLFAGY